MMLSELRCYFQREWHSMGNSSLFGFDGVIRRSEHEVSPRWGRWIQRIGGSGARRCET